MIQIYSIGIIALLSAMSPGPDFVILSKYALCESRASAIFCALGIALGIVFHASYCVLGLAIIISKSIVVFNLIKYLGAAYLIYLGIQGLRTKKQTIINAPTDNVSKTYYQAFKQGLGVNALNPKCSLFMLSVFTLVIEPHSSRWVQLGYGLEIALIALVWFTLLACSISIKPIKERFGRFQQWISRLTGAVLIALGIKTATEA